MAKVQDRALPGVGKLFLWWLRGPFPALQLSGVWGGEERGSGSPRPEFSCGFYLGVACITLSFVDEGGAPISLASWPPSSPGPPDLLREEEFEQLITVTRCPVLPDSSSGGAAWSEEGCSVML